MHLATTMRSTPDTAWAFDEEAKAIRYYTFDYSTGEIDGGDCADAAWEHQYVEVPDFTADPFHADLDGDSQLIVAEWACARLHGDGTLEASLCLIRS